jgi:putative membrane protein
MDAPFQPSLNAALNALSMVLLTLGWRAIKRGRRTAHRNWMIAALASSAVFLASYLVYHARVGSTPYPYQDWTRPVYFGVLVPHILLAGLMAPFILAAVALAWRARFAAHARITRWLWPVWMYVSVSGVAIYLMLYRP